MYKCLGSLLTPKSNPPFPPLSASLLTLLVAVDLPDDDLSRLQELLRGAIRRLVPLGRQQVAEAAPVRVEVDEHELGVG